MEDWTVSEEQLRATHPYCLAAGAAFQEVLVWIRSAGPTPVASMSTTLVSILVLVRWVTEEGRSKTAFKETRGL